MTSHRLGALQALGEVSLIDTQHDGRSAAVGVYLLPVGEGRFVLIETGPGTTLEVVIAGIQASGFELEALATILVTHVHLDHAGAAGALVGMSNADVVVHELGGRHLVDPTKLLASAARIYGDEMERLWGSMKPIPEERVRPVSGGETLRIGKQKISVIYTPGHASHHVSYLLDDGSLFAGDALGIRLSGFPVIRPALPPPEVDIELWDASLNSIVIVEPKRFLLTHFGEVLDVGQHLNQLRAQNHLWADAILKGMKAGETRYELQRRIHGLSNLDLSKAGADAELADCYNDSSNAEMTVMGLSRYWRKRCPSLPGGDP